MADDTDLNLDDLEEDEVRATDSKEEDIEEVFAEDEQTEITSRELEAVYVNNRLVARGEVVIVEERLGVTMTEIIKSDRT